MHGKEQAIAPILQEQLGVQVIVPADFDTDRFGTFTREIKRPGTQLETARAKIESALTLTGETLGLASEGSFGPHPVIPYICFNREIVVLVDKAHDLEIVGEVYSTETNFNHQTVSSLEAADQFAQTIGFPSHAVTVRVDRSGEEKVIKGICTATQLEDALDQAFQTAGQAFLETDMRALYNPTRMKNIAQATRNLVEKINHRCPSCSYPGFEVSDRRSGLPCGLCGWPTQLTLSEIYQCRQCGFKQEFPTGLKTADPMYCSYCNP